MNYGVKDCSMPCGSYLSFFVDDDCRGFILVLYY